MRFLSPGGLFFAQYSFDPRRRALYKQGRRVVLRAKAAEVLHVLLCSADDIVSKQSLRERVWGHDGVTDQSLFQAISEVRRALAPLEAVVTHPNQGYRWALPVRTRRWPAHGLAASLAIVIAAGAVALAAWQIPPAPTSGLRSLSPSMQAFATGVTHLAAGDAHQAITMLSLALQEDASFLDARLMLGEAFLARGEVARALDEARGVLLANEARSEPDTHATVAAMALISRAEGSSGADSRALHWAFEAAQRAHRGGLVCTASDMEQRIDQLLAQRARAAARAPARAAAPVRPPPSSMAASDPRPATPAYCSQLPVSTTPPEARAQPEPCPVPAIPRRFAALAAAAKSVA